MNCNGRIRLRGPRDDTDEFNSEEYVTLLARREPWSYLKFLFYRPGISYGSYRLDLGMSMLAIPYPEASAELAAFRKLTDDGIVHYTMYYHYARLIEIMYAIERMEELLHDEDIVGSELRITSNSLQPEGIGVIEAPRGTLIHHYQVNEKGAITKVNLIVATGHNNYAMNKGVELVAKKYIHGESVEEGVLNRMEHVIRL